MKENKPSPVLILISCLCDMAGFVTITYLLCCAEFAFSANPVSILLFAANCWLYSLFWQNLHRCLSKELSIFVTLLACLCVAALLYFVGFLPFEGEMIHLPLL